MMEDWYADGYAEWANDDFLWGNGMCNWGRSYSLEEWKKKEEKKDKAYLLINHHRWQDDLDCWHF